MEALPAPWTKARAFQSYKGYRIYLTREGNFLVNAQGQLLVHVEIADSQSGDHECIAIAGCLAAFYAEACERSIKQAMLIIDSRLTPKER
jgi:hypothetical protein